MITVDDILKLEEWVARANNPDEKKAREERAREQVFPRGLDDDEIARRKEVVDRAKAAQRQNERDAELDPMPSLSVPYVPVSVPSQWEGLIPKSSKAYRRGSMHDGTAAELAQLKTESKGSPFDVGLPPAKKK